MRNQHLAFLAILSFPGVAVAQFPGVDITGTISASVSAPVPCETCSDLAVHRSAGVLIRNAIGIGYRGVRWGDQSPQSTSRMASDLVAIDLYLPTHSRLRPFLSGGAGHSSARIRFWDGGHVYYDYGPASALRTTFWAGGIDLRSFKRLAFTSMISLTATAPSSAQYCANPNYLSGSSTYTCTPAGSQRYAVRGLSVGVGVR